MIEMASDLSTNGEIADRLCITVSAVKHHITNLNRKFGTRNRMEILKKLYDMVSDKMAKDLAVLGPTGVTLWRGRTNGSNESHSA